MISDLLEIPMDTTLVTVSLLSMGMAGALSVIVWRMLRDEQQRSEARVIALTDLSHRPMTRQSGIPSRDPRRENQERASAVSELPLREEPAGSAALFEVPEQSSPWGHRFAVMTAVALIFASVIFVALAANGRKAPAVAAAAGAAPAVNAASGIPAGLELLSLRDSRDADSLTITGLVQNPRGGAPLTRVTVTAYTFDDKGSFLASGRALIDVTSLAPGDESPFVVSVPITSVVARYRIGFRTEDGRVIAHIDKRQQGPIAANW